MSLITSRNQPLQFYPIPERCNIFDTRCYVPFWFTGDHLIYQIKSEEVAFSDNLITNGDFSTDPGTTVIGHWNKGTDWVIALGEAIGTAGTASDLSANVPLTYKKVYLVNYDLTIISGSISVNHGEARIATGSYSEYIQVPEGTIENFAFTKDAAFEGAVDNVEVFETLGRAFLHTMKDEDGNTVDVIMGDYGSETIYPGAGVANTIDITLSEDLDGCYRIGVQSFGQNMVIDSGITNTTNWDIETIGFGAWTINQRANLNQDGTNQLTFNTKNPIILTGIDATLELQFEYSFTNSGIVTVVVKVDGVTRSTTNISGLGIKEIQFDVTSDDEQVMIYFDSNVFMVPVAFTGYIDSVFLREVIDEGESNLFKVLPLEKQTDCGLSCANIIEYRNDNDAFGLMFSGQNFTPTFRLLSEVKNPKYTEEGKRFTDSLGQRYALNIDRKQKWEFVIDDIPEWLHNVVSIAKVSDHFYINRVEYSPEVEDYVPEWKENLTLAPSRFDVFLAIENNYNGNC